MRTKVSRGLRDAAVPLLAVIGVLLVAWEARLGADPRGPLQQPYPILGVGFFAVVIAIEALVVWGILRPRSYDRSWLRALLALLLVAGFFFGWPSLQDGPRFQHAHFQWLALMAIVLLSLAVVSFASEMARRITLRSTRRAPRAG